MLCCQLLALLIHSHLETFSATIVINLIDVFLFLPANSNLIKALQSDWPTNIYIYIYIYIYTDLALNVF